MLERRSRPSERPTFLCFDGLSCAAPLLAPFTARRSAAVAIAAIGMAWLARQRPKDPLTRSRRARRQQSRGRKRPITYASQPLCPVCKASFLGEMRRP